MFNTPGSSTNVRPDSARRLPVGGTLSDREWTLRQRVGLALVWVHAPVFAILALRRGDAPRHALADITVIVALAAVATLAESRPRGISRTVRASLVAAGLLSCSIVLVHLSDGMIEAHFHFFVVVGLLTLYRQWVPFLIAVSYVAAHHFWMGLQEPELVYNHPAALASPGRWALVHTLAVAAAAGIHLLSWRMEDRARQQTWEAETALAESRRRQHQAALELHDELVQGLATSLYALDHGEPQTSRSAIAGSLEHAKHIVTELLEGAEARRQDAASPLEHHIDA